MKNHIILQIFMIYSSICFGFTELDTLYVNENKAVALFFPAPIKQAITGNGRFTFTYNRESPQHMGLLQGVVGEEGNLLVITNDGQVYAYILKYREQLDQLNYFIDIKKSIGSERPKIIKERTRFQNDSVLKLQKYFQRYSEFLLASSSGNLKTKRSSGIKLQLERIAYSREQTYVVMEIKNKSGIALEMEYLEIFRVQGNQRKKSSYQKLALTPIYKYLVPEKVYNSQSFRFVYVFPKFVLGKDEKLQLELQENRGRRKLIFKTHI